MRTTRYTAPAVAALLLAASAPTAHAADRTERVSVGASGRQADGASRAPSISGQGRYVAFDSTATNLVSPPFAEPIQQVYRRDRRAGTTVLVSLG